MKCVQLLLVFAFFIFPSFINADKIKCQSGYQCHKTLSQTIMEVRVNFESPCTNGCVHNGKEDCESCGCEDACVYYKCVLPGQYIFEGAGCYSDFDSTCLYTKTETKNQVIKNITKTSSGSSEYYDNTTMIVTCRSNNCARDAFEKMAPKAQKNFGSTLSDVIFFTKKPDNCELPSFAQPFQEKAQLVKTLCSKREWCETGKKFDMKYFGLDVDTQGVKECDACVFYRCTADGGRNIMSGFGCYEDFEKICQNVPSDVKESIKLNIKDSFHFDGGNYVVTTCSDSRNCAQKKYGLYSDANPSSRIKVDKTADGVCEVGVVGSVSPHQINIWLLLGLFFAGILYRMA